MSRPNREQQRATEGDAFVKKDEKTEAETVGVRRKYKTTLASSYNRKW